MHERCIKSRDPLKLLNRRKRLHLVIFMIDCHSKAKVDHSGISIMFRSWYAALLYII